MRRSKSDPAKYARNYRTISQRRMTQYDGIDEEKEIERLRNILTTSESHLRKDVEQTKENKRKQSEEEAQRANLADSLLSKDIVNSQAYGEDGNDLVLLPRKKKVRKTRGAELTPQEIRQAKLNKKNADRKLKQLTARADQKKRREGIYSKLQKTAISEQEMELLATSSTLGKKQTKREMLKRLLQKERAGIQLTQDEHGILYQDRQVIDGGEGFAGEVKAPPDGPAIDTENPPQERNQTEGQLSDKKKRKKRKKRTQTKVAVDSDIAKKEEGQDDMEQSHGQANVTSSEDQTDGLKVAEQSTKPDLTSRITSTVLAGTVSGGKIDFAAMMMSGLSSLKRKTEEEQVVTTAEGPSSELERIALDEAKREKRGAPYVPVNPVVVKTAAVIGLQPSDLKNNRKVMPLERPESVEESRYNLPVAGMEFEIVDSIRNNDVTIVCSETGSGKSTQVPQFLYEAGFTAKGGLLIGVTQPRRVAAVSTAKRVCYEMGVGDGQTIKGSEGRGNLVAYQTRYETSGLGEATRVKFMTDGILLQEVQSDLLLRKYSVIVLDEAHERNLNTDVLLGLLSVSIPMRKKATTESGMAPLKLVVMSATLRVEDFTSNDRLFPTAKPSVIRVPGRLFPVTIHHSKVTELDDYESVALNKVVKIHRKLPNGGILVFMTGKQEITRLIKNLKRRLKAQIVQGSQPGDAKDVENTGSDFPRDLDNDEADGDEFREEYEDDFEDMDDPDLDLNEDSHRQENGADDDDENRPKNVVILPLYSMLSIEEQARVFAPIPEGTRLIVVSTNIAETSVTIPGISYVVDTGRQKCRSYHSGTGVASYDVMWISKAAADQRAGRAGRTGPGHCYRLYSSSMYSRHMQDFALPEVLTRPLEDVVLSMKAMNVSNVANFPFPTLPDQSQIDGAIKLLANLGCVDLSTSELDGSDGKVTRLGSSVAKLPLGVRYGKMLLVAAQAGVLDYAIVIVAILSESSPFQHDTKKSETDGEKEGIAKEEEDSNNHEEIQNEKKARNKWTHSGGDLMATMLAVGAYTYAGRGAGGTAEKIACRQFCEKNGLNMVVMERIQKMRMILARFARNKFGKADSVAARTGGIVSTMKPPNKLQENLLRQVIVSGLMDNVALLAPPGSLTGEHPFGFRTAYISCSTAISEPLYIDQQSTVYSRDFRQLPRWVCFDSIVRKTTKTGLSVANMKNITPIDASWLGILGKGTRMVSLGEPLPSPQPCYDAEKDLVLCSVRTKFSPRGWEIPPIQAEMFGTMQKHGKTSKDFLIDDSFRWFARFLLEGKVFGDFRVLVDCWNDEPSIITRKTPVRKVALLVSALSSEGIDSAGALRKHWAEVDNKFLFKLMRDWTKLDHASTVKKVWMATVKKIVAEWGNVSN